METWITLAAALGLVLVPSISSLEAATSGANRARLRQLAEGGSARARELDALLEERARLLTSFGTFRSILTVLLGILLAVWSSVEFPGDSWALVAVSSIGLVGVLLLEVAFRRIAALRAERFIVTFLPLLRVARSLNGPLVDAVLWLTRPLVRLVGTANDEEKTEVGPSKEEIGLMVEEGHDIEEDEKEMIQSIFEFGETMAKEIMVPRVDMACVEVTTPLNKVLDIAVAHGHSRLPVYEENVDNIVGIVYSRDLMHLLRERKMDTNLRSVMRPAFLVPGSKRIDDLLREMQKEKVTIAVVVDEYGGTDGLITMEDLIEEIVGEITDEYDKEMPPVETLPSGAIIVDAKMSIEDVNEHLGSSIPVDDYETIGGFFYGLLGKVPNPGETAEVDGLRITVETVHRQRIIKLKIERKEKDTDEPVS